MHFDIIDNGFDALKTYLSQFGLEGLCWDEPVLGYYDEDAYGLRFNPDDVGKIIDVKGYNFGETSTGIQVLTRRRCRNSLHWKGLCNALFDRAHAAMIVKNFQEKPGLWISYFEFPESLWR